MLATLIAFLNLTSAQSVNAQTFSTLHSFVIDDGTNPIAGLVTSSSGDILYGAANSGGSSGSGSVFAVNADGAAFTNLYAFTLLVPQGPIFSVNSDGGNPWDGLILSGQTLYGTARTGGSGGVGTIFAVNVDGSGFTNLHNFTYNEGAFPKTGLILSGNTLFGTTSFAGISGGGTVFALNTDGSGFKTLYDFSATDGPPNGLLLSGAALYGTTFGGSGSVFKLDTAGNGFTNLYTFTTTISGTNTDGASPAAGLILSGNTLYGTASAGGRVGGGTVFSLRIDGTGFKNLHSFNPAADGYSPKGRLTLFGNSLCGTAAFGGNALSGTLFAVKTNGLNFAILHGFTPISSGTNFDGASPQGQLILSGNALYGTASQGGSAGKGTVFRLSLAPQLTVTRSGGIVTLSWPANVAGFDYTGYRLQSAITVTGPFTDVPAATSPFSKLITTTQQFFRLQL